MVGQKYNRLTVVKRGENDKKGGTRWWCKCDCGNPELVLINAYDLKSGNSKSCGCLHKEKMFEVCKKYNTYDLSGEYGIGYTTNGEEFYFDLEDYDLIKDYCWYKNNYDYFVAGIIVDNKQSILLIHRLIMRAEDSLFIDHIYHKKYDNRKSQLRIVSNQQNTMNSQLYKNNTSGIAGVFFRKDTKKWAARIMIDGKNINLGSYISKDDAIKARKHAEKKYFGEYAYRTGEDNWQEKHQKN